MPDESWYCGSTDGTVTTWHLFYDQRPWTLNAERNWHHMKRAKLVKEWREAFWALTLEAQVPKLEAISVVVTPVLADKRTQDVANCLPAAKAAIDGIVDAGVIPDDDPTHLKAITFNAPEHHKPSGLRVVVRAA